MSKLYFSYAAMNAGKSTLLLQASWNYHERGMRTMLLTSALYAEGSAGRITSRIGIDAEAHLYTQRDNLYIRIAAEQKRHQLDCVFVDEAQFLTRDQVWQLARVADRLGIPVMCFGLRTDFQGRLFEGSSELLAIADSLREIRTICHCGRKAIMVVRRSRDGRALTQGEQVSIDKSLYVSLCRRHWEEETGRWPPAASRRTREKPEPPPAKPASARRLTQTGTSPKPGLPPDKVEKRTRPVRARARLKTGGKTRARKPAR